jgi:hypothetical protein
MSAHLCFPPPSLHLSMTDCVWQVTDRELSWPEDFPEVARDLVDKLLAAEPAERLGEGGKEEETLCRSIDLPPSFLSPPRVLPRPILPFLTTRCPRPYTLPMCKTSPPRRCRCLGP